MQLEQLIDVPIYLIDGLGEKLKNKNIPFGSAATPDSIAAAYSIHIQRELDAPSGIIVLDRCIIDAIAYVRSLRVTSSQQTELFEVITRCRAADLDLLVHLQMTHPFAQSAADHESAELREEVGAQILKAIDELKLNHISINAADESAVDRVSRVIVEKVGRT
ncbi:hypothetical protein JCM16408A_12970 [Methylobacterium phyllosphaerae]